MIGDNIKKAREIKGISQKELSEIGNIPRISLGRYERCERTPNMDTLNKIANALMVNIDVLLSWTDNILINEDILKFLEDLYPKKYYEFLDIISELTKIINLDKHEFELMSVLSGTSPDKDIYIALSNAIGLNKKQTYNWILTNTISQVLDEKGLSQGRYAEMIKKIIKENLLSPQPIEDLLKNGLSIENKSTLYKCVKEHQSKLEEVLLNRSISIADTYRVSIDDAKQNIINIESNPKFLLNSILRYLEEKEEFYTALTIDLYGNKSDNLDYFTDEQINSIVKKVTDLVEYEIYKIEKEN